MRFFPILSFLYTRTIIKGFHHVSLFRNLLKVFLFIILLYCLHSYVFARGYIEQKIFLDQSFINQVNAETPGNQIPWFQDQEKYDVKLEAKLTDERQLTKIIRGDYSYTLYRFSYSPEKLIEGEFPYKELTFYIERQFPTRESGIVYKELWPFNKTGSLIFKLRKNEKRFVIVSIE